MVLTNASVGLLLAALAAWWGLDWLLRSGRGGASRGVPANLLRAGLVVAALAAHLNLFDLTRHALVASIPTVHSHETFHYYLGTRYFAELGYTGLYSAVVLADFEDDRTAHAPSELVRDLSTNQFVSRGRALAAGREARAAFSDERWEAFKRDVARHRNASTPRRWKLALQDHGYNGTPMVTALLGLVANQPWISSEGLLDAVLYLDTVLILLFCAGFGVREGVAAGLSVLFFVYANPLNDFSFVGASYLRYGYFLALAGALWALRRDRLATCGVLLALSGWLRIFPLVIYGVLALRDVASGRWRERLVEGRRLHVGFAIASIAILAGTSLLPTPDGRNPWLSFAENIRQHAGAPGINQVFLAVPLTYSPERDRRHARQQPGADRSAALAPRWRTLTEQARRERAWPVRATAIVLLGLGFVALRRSSRTGALLPAWLAVFCVLPMSHYYWAVLSLLPIARPDDTRIKNALLALFASLALLSARSLFQDQLDLRFALMSAALLAFLLYGCLVVRGSRGCDPRPAEATAPEVRPCLSSSDPPPS